MIARRPTRGARAPCLGALTLVAALAAAPAQAGELVFFAETGPEVVDGDPFALVEPALRWRGDRLSAELAAPLRLGLGRAAGAPGAPRRRHWDSPSDAGRLLPRLELELGARVVVLRAGALAHQTLGHGTLVNDFSMQLDPDQAPLGVAVRLAKGPFALELLASDVLAVGVFGASASLDPTALFGAEGDRVHLSASAFADPRAPRAAGEPDVALWGAGADAVVLRGRLGALAPYVDANARATEGWGLHAGLLADLNLDPVALALKVEWRRTAGAYLPEYFDLAYAVERWDSGVVGPGGPRPRADVAAPAANAARFELRTALPGLSLAAAAAVQPNRAIEGSAVIRAEIGALELAATGAHRPAAQAGGDARWLALSEARYRLTRFVYAWAVGGRLYAVEGGRARRADHFGLGLGLALSPG